MVTEEIPYEAGGMSFKGLLARPAGDGPWPAILVAHESFGLAQHTRDVAVKLAKEGFVAFALDYVGNGTPLTELADVVKRIEEWVADPQPLRQACAQAHQILTRLAYVDSSRIAGYGDCFGAQALVEYARTGADLTAIVGFHPGLSANRPSESRLIRSKLLMLVGTDDPITPKEQRLAFEDEMTAAGVYWRMMLYGGVVHSFTIRAADAYGLPGVRYDASADEDSWLLARVFLNECGITAVRSE
jgi:dienelactone hydrolase